MIPRSNGDEDRLTASASFESSFMRECIFCHSCVLSLESLAHPVARVLRYVLRAVFAEDCELRSTMQQFCLRYSLFSCTAEPESTELKLFQPIMANATYEEDVVNNAVRSEISNNIVNLKANVCPMTIRLAWHASGTYNKDDTSEKKGGSDGATMRFEPEMTDGANAGLDFMMKILKPVKKRFPSMSYADLWVVAGCQAIKLMGGPDVPVKYGRTDMESNSACPMNGRLPDAGLGSEHLREVFYRMGFDDKDIVALSGAVRVIVIYNVIGWLLCSVSSDQFDFDTLSCHNYYQQSIQLDPVTRIVLDLVDHGHPILLPLITLTSKTCLKLLGQKRNGTAQNSSQIPLAI